MTSFSVGSRVRIQHGKPWRGTIEMSGVVRSFEDGILVIQRTFKAGGRYDSLGDEKRAGDHGLIEAIEGAWVMRRVYFRANGELIGELFNVQTSTQFAPGLVTYTDLEVDVVRHGDGRVVVVDEDDLREAVALGGISSELADAATAIAHELARQLRRGGDWRDVATAPRQSGSPGAHSPAPGSD